MVIVGSFALFQFSMLHFFPPTHNDLLTKSVVLTVRVKIEIDSLHLNSFGTVTCLCMHSAMRGDEMNVCTHAFVE
jgi:hypothetical protein